MGCHDKCRWSAPGCSSSTDAYPLPPVRQTSYHDSSWLRRPRSRIGSRSGSRCATPLSRQNSMSMEDFSATDSGHLPRLANRVASSARSRRAPPTSPRKSFSTDSFKQFDSDFQTPMPPPTMQRDRDHHGRDYQQQQQQGPILKNIFTVNSYQCYRRYDD